MSLAHPGLPGVTQQVARSAPYPHTVASPGLRLTTSQVPLRALLPSPFPFTAAGLSNGGGRRRVFVCNVVAVCPVCVACGF